MDNYTANQLKEMIRQAKKEHKTCKPFSKLKKDELYAHAVELGLISSSQISSKSDPLDRITRVLNFIQSVPDFPDKKKALNKVGKLYNAVLTHGRMTDKEAAKLLQYEKVLS